MDDVPLRGRGAGSIQLVFALFAYQGPENYKPTTPGLRVRHANYYYCVHYMLSSAVNNDDTCVEIRWALNTNILADSLGT